MNSRALKLLDDLKYQLRDIKYRSANGEMINNDYWLELSAKNRLKVNCNKKLLTSLETAKKVKIVETVNDNDRYIPTSYIVELLEVE